MLSAPRRWLVVAVLAALAVAFPALAAAQTLEGPIVSSWDGVPPDEVATGRDGGIVVVGEIYNGPQDRLSQYFPDGELVPRPPVVLPGVNSTHWKLTDLAIGGYVLAWQTTVPILDHTVTVQRLSATGAFLGSPMFAAPQGAVFQQVGIAPLGDGFVAGWVQDGLVKFRLFDAHVAPIGPVTNIGSEKIGNFSGVFARAS
jgi:hypothetical protein